MVDRSELRRLFIAIKPDKNVLQKLTRVIAPMAAEPWAKQVRWIDADNIHMTVRFLGNSNIDIIGDLCAALKSVLLFDAIDYQINAIAAFPSTSKPSVIAALVAASNALTCLADEVEKTVREFGFQPDHKRFRGHLTLGRCRRGFPKKTGVQQPIKPICAKAEEIIIYESKTNPTGAVYLALAGVKFVGVTRD